MTAVLVAGAIFGVGLVGLLASLLPTRERIVPLIEMLDGEAGSLGATAMPDAVVQLDGPISRFGYRPARYLMRSPRLRDGLVSRLGPALALTGSSPELLAAQSIGAAGAAALLLIVLWGVMRSEGVHPPFYLPGFGVLVAGIAGAAVPFAALASEAKDRRRQARRSLGAFLDLVVLAMAGGMGVEGALQAASSVGDDWMSARLARTIALARGSGTSLWSAFATLGEEIGVEELEELAAAVALAGQEGARVRATLAAKAASIRRHELADAEKEANTVTERLFLPGVLLLAGFLVFVGYPALARVMTGI
jgi:tight adherence protein C